MRVLLFTGKGGVGKTTTSAATALHCAQQGRRTLVLSTDPAHSLADAFDLALYPEPTPVTDHLWGQQLDSQARLEDSWSEIQDYLVEVFDWAGVSAVEAEELAVVPGLDEIFALSDIKAHAASGEWDVVVVDCAPTAETLRLLSLPDVLSWAMERLFPMGRRMNRMVGPVLRKVTNLPVARDEVFGAGERFYARLDGVKELLSNPDVTSIRLVLTPDRMVLAEARRTLTYLSLFGYPTDAVIANRLLPDEIADPWFDRWRGQQDEHMAEIRQTFGAIPVLSSQLAPAEVVGTEALTAFAAQLWSEVDPVAVLHRGRPLRVDREDGTWVMRVELPFAERDDLELGRRGDDLLLRAGAYRHRMTLPDSLRHRPVSGAGLDGGVLTVTFGDAAGRAADPRPAPTGSRVRTSRGH